MTPKEKAKALYDRFSLHTTHLLDPEVEKVKWNAKQCALIAVDEILNDYEIFNEKHKSYKVPSFWQDVKRELENL